jgi:hypothetical protein
MNLFYKFKVAGMSQDELVEEILLRACSTKVSDFKKLEYITQTRSIDFEGMAQRFIVSGDRVALHRLLLLPQVSDEQKSWCLWFAYPRGMVMETIFMHKPPCTQAQKDDWLAGFLINGFETSARMMVKNGASLERAIALAEEHVLAKKDQLEEKFEEKKKELSELCERIVISCKKIATPEQKPKP